MVTARGNSLSVSPEQMCMRGLCKSGACPAWMDTSADVVALTVNRSVCMSQTWLRRGPSLTTPPPPPRVSLLWRTLCGAWRWDCGSGSAAWADGAPPWGTWFTPSRESATPNTSSAWRCRTTWTPWAAWSSSIWCFPQGEAGTPASIHHLLDFFLVFRETCRILSHHQTVLLFSRSHMTCFVCVCTFQTVRGTDELPAKVRRGREAVGGLAAAWPVWAALGEAVQQLRRRLPPQPIGHPAEHHRGAVVGPLAPECSGAPAAADRRGPAGSGPHACHGQRDGTWISGVWEGECFHVINKENHPQVQAGYTKIVHLLVYQ